MDYILQKALLIAVGVVIALIIISSVLFVYDQIVNIYTTVDKVDIRLVAIDDEYAKFDNNIMRGVEILNAIKRYKQEKEGMVIRFNLVKNGSFTQIDRAYDWDTYINRFNGGNASYVVALSNTYVALKTILPDNRIRLEFTCQ